MSKAINGDIIENGFSVLLRYPGNIEIELSKEELNRMEIIKNKKRNIDELLGIDALYGTKYAAKVFNISRHTVYYWKKKRMVCLKHSD
jgi:hypothetical protein